MSNLSQNVGIYLIQRLYDHGVRHILCVPGDFMLGFYEQLMQSNKQKVINTCDELGSAFAAVKLQLLELMDWELYVWHIV